jgi:TonB family protein
MDDRSLAFLTGSPLSRPRMRLGRAFSISLGTHVAALAVIALLVSRPPAPGGTAMDTRSSADLVWLAPGPGGGIGAGGDESEAAPRAARARGDGAVAVPASAARSLEPAEEVRPVVQTPVVSGLTQPATAGLDEVSGLLRPVAFSEPDSRGPGTGDGAGGRHGSGVGPGEGSEIGTGGRGGVGDGPGGGGQVVPPRLLAQVRPEYTPQAMSAKVSGVVTMEAVVLPDGSVGDVRIVRSLDRIFGLDLQAIRAVKQWRFAPGSRRGQPIPMIVSIELTFTLR